MQQQDKSFRGGVFSEDETGGRASAELSLEASALLARTPEGREYRWPYGDLEVEVGGSSGHMVFCRVGGSGPTAFSDQRGFLEALERAAGGLLEGRIATARAAVRKRKRSSQLTALTLLGLLALAAVGLFFGLSLAAVWAVDSLPISVDQQLGEVSAPLINEFGDETLDPILVEPVRAIVALLEPEAVLKGFEYDVHVVQSDQVNAFALPGGTVVVLTGLLAEAESPEEVAGVLAHEIAHVTLRHGLKRIARSAGGVVVFKLFLGNVDGLLGVAASMANQATLLGHSRGQESEADLEGARMLHGAGIDPEGLADFFALLEAQAEDSPEIPVWFSTHPEHSSRVNAIHARLDELGPGRYEDLGQRLDLDWKAIRERARSLTEGDTPQSEDSSSATQ